MSAPIEICGFENTNGCTPMTKGAVFGAIFPFAFVFVLVWLAGILFMYLDENEEKFSLNVVYRLACCGRARGVEHLPSNNVTPSGESQFSVDNVVAVPIDEQKEAQAGTSNGATAAATAAALTDAVPQSNENSAKFPLGWTCAACTYVNASTDNTCTLCSSARPVAEN